MGSVIFQQELSKGYQHDRVEKVFKYFCVLVPFMKVDSVLEGFKSQQES